MANNIIVRIQSPKHGMKRIQTKPIERVQDFLDKVRQEFDLSHSGWNVYKKRNQTDEVKSSRSKTLSSYKVKHGDMLYLGFDADIAEVASASTSMSMTGSLLEPRHVISAGGAFADNKSSSSSTRTTVQEDEVDQYLEKQDGRIERDRDEHLCRHGPQGKCLHCVPVEPYDEDYMKKADPPIKFLSFHSHIRKLTGGVDRGKFTNLENLSCKIKSGCKEHPPWPGGICTKCQPNAVTLNQQKYRHVDYIQLENRFMVERFLNYWRNTGSQRLGFLYGKYQLHKDVPLGIKAVVSAIYEPPQIGTKNSIELLEDDREAAVNRVAQELGLTRVGWIFTDLVAEDTKKGTVKHIRGNVDSHFLTAEECVMAADFQNKHPNPCKLSSEGHFGSKFVTVVVTGDSKSQVHFEGYQVSNQCMALVRDNCLVPTIDAPELGYAKESTNEQYVPDVFYALKDEYSNEVTRLARPLPVEYLLVDLAVGFPMEPSYTFYYDEAVTPFPVEDRSDIGEIQDFNAFTRFIQQFSPDKFFESMSDFHVLIYLATCDMLPLKDKMGVLLEAVGTRNQGLAERWARSEEWATVEQLMEVNSPLLSTTHSLPFVTSQSQPLPPIGGAAAGGGAQWTCAHCTFLNPTTSTTCEMCSLPK